MINLTQSNPKLKSEPCKKPYLFNGKPISLEDYIKIFLTFRPIEFRIITPKEYVRLAKLFKMEHSI